MATFLVLYSLQCGALVRAHNAIPLIDKQEDFSHFFVQHELKSQKISILNRNGFKKWHKLLFTNC